VEPDVAPQGEGVGKAVGALLPSLGQGGGHPGPVGGELGEGIVEEPHHAVCLHAAALRRVQGVGLAAGMKSIGYGAFPEHVNVKIQLTRNGTYEVFLSNPEMGSGTSTALKQIAAQALHTTVPRVQLSPRNTKHGVDSGGSDASRVVYVIGNAIIKTADELKKRLMKHAARKLKTTTNRLRLTPTAITGRGKRLTLRDLAQARTISATAWYSVPRPQEPLAGAMSIPNTLFSYAASAANVEVNLLTGEVKVLAVTFVPEVGAIINPRGLEAQCEGGIAQSIGYALMEDMQVDEGKVRTPNFTSYVVPTIQDVANPIILPVTDAYEPTGPFGAKGAGELSTITVPAAICNAIYDATHARLTTLPATPERVLTMIEKASKQSVA
jgi:CO/xanthine dehydrogenase Mo-binding subunit